MFGRNWTKNSFPISKFDILVSDKNQHWTFLSVWNHLNILSVHGTNDLVIPWVMWNKSEMKTVELKRSVGDVGCGTKRESTMYEHTWTKSWSTSNLENNIGRSCRPWTTVRRLYWKDEKSKQSDDELVKVLKRTSSKKHHSPNAKQTDRVKTGRFNQESVGFSSLNLKPDGFGYKTLIDDPHWKSEHNFGCIRQL